MSLLVVDSSVAVKWLVPEHDTAEAKIVWDAFDEGRIEVAAPDWIDVEVANILWAKATKRKFISTAEAADHLDDFRAKPFRRVPAVDLLPAALDLAVRFDRTVYDSLYLALSERESCPFVTADERLVNAVNPPLTGPVKLADWAAANPAPPAGGPPNPPSP